MSEQLLIKHTQETLKNISMKSMITFYSSIPMVIVMQLLL